MKLVIVESPTKSNTIAHYLGNEYTVLASKGHVKDLSTSGKGGLGVDILNNFEPTYVVLKDKYDIVKKLKKEALGKEVILATDPDREGEAIAYSLAKVLSLDIKKTKRLEFHEITKNSILKALANPRTIDMNLVHAQEARRIIDRIMGFKLSALLKSKIRSESAGRVQSVALGILVAKEKEIQAFKSEKFYLLKVSILLNNKDYDLTLYSYKNKRLDNFKDLNEAKVAFDSLSNELIVDNIIKKEKNIVSKEPFRTSTLQQAANSIFGFSTKLTSSLAQELYEGIKINDEPVGLITYMRTDSTRLSSDFVKSAKDYIISKYGEKYYKGEKINKSIKNSQDAHEAIRPTSISRTPESIKKYLSNNAYKLYKLIFDRTLASLMSDKVILSKSINLISNDLVFKLNGYEIIFDGYEAIKTKVASENEELSYFELPNIKKGTKVPLKNKEIKEDETKPPLRYSEGKLVKIMEEKGIGRPSTYSSTIQTLIKRKYITLSKGILCPTEQGILTSNVLEKYFPEFISVKYTADMESSLDKIQNGELKEIEVLNSFYEPFMAQFDIVKEKMYKEPLKETGELCPNCGSKLVYKNGKYGQFIGCSNYPKCHYIKKEIKEPLKEVGKKCPNCGHPLVYRKNKKGEKFIACSNYPKCRYIDSGDNFLTKNKFCPKCGASLVVKRGKRGKFLACSSYPNCDYIENIK